MNTWDTVKIRELIKDCARIAMDYYDNPPIEYKEDRSVVTAADKAIEAKLALYFDRPDENVYMIGEETSALRDEEYIKNALSGTAWIVDPIDGTAPYSNHMPMWGISIAFMQAGVIKEGAIFVPVTGELLITEGEKVFYASSASWDLSELASVPLKKAEINDAGIISVSQKISKEGKFLAANPVMTLSCCVYSALSLFTGRALAYLGTVKLWDIAAGLAIGFKLGFCGRLSDGTILTAEVSSKIYNMDKSAKSRWSLRGHFILAARMDIVDYVERNTVYPS